MYSDAVENAQRVLRAVAGYRGRIDGDPGPQTLAAAARVTAGRPGVLEPAARAVAAAQVALEAAGLEPGPIDGKWGPSTDAAFRAWRGEPLPTRMPDTAAAFGPPGSPRCTAGVVRPPWRMVLAWDTDQAITEIRCHEIVAPSAQRALERVAADLSMVQIRALGLHLFGGCFNLRHKRGGTTWSTHAYGIALDFDPARNRLHWGADRARLAQPDAAPWWDAWAAEGWHSLGRARNFDWMHVQAVPV